MFSKYAVKYILHYALQMDIDIKLINLIISVSITLLLVLCEELSKLDRTIVIL